MSIVSSQDDFPANLVKWCSTVSLIAKEIQIRHVKHRMFQFLLFHFSVMRILILIGNRCKAKYCSSDREAGSCVTHRTRRLRKSEWLYVSALFLHYSNRSNFISDLRLSDSIEGRLSPLAFVRPYIPADPSDVTLAKHYFVTRPQCMKAASRTCKRDI